MNVQEIDKQIENLRIAYRNAIGMDRKIIEIRGKLLKKQKEQLMKKQQAMI